jgi:hypothetical protein
MTWSRRKFVLTGVGLLATGCSQRPLLVGTAPNPTWPDARNRPRPDGDLLPWVPPPTTPTNPAGPTVAAGSVQVGPIAAIARGRWARGRPISSRLNPLSSIHRVTVHHEGHKDPVRFDDWRNSSLRMEHIRRSHLDRGFGDIGYHLMIDRAGRIWQGRNLRFQGAHVREHNENNLGIMVLGNFNKQSPTSAQLARLDDLLPKLTRFFGVSPGHVHTHRELMPTTCPGKRLQKHMVTLRRNGRFV